MTTVARLPGAMVLPVVEPCSGEVSGPPLVVDLPVPVPFAHDRPPHLLAHWARTEQCPNGRHLWDVIVATAPEGGEDEDDCVDRVPFRMVLTCVRCGSIERLAGVREDDRRGWWSSSVDPVPLRCGSLVAQQVGGFRHGGDSSSWTVHADGDPVPVGVMAWARGPRGRQYFKGRLDTWPTGRTVQGSTPGGCLRKLAMANAAGDERWRPRRNPWRSSRMREHSLSSNGSPSCRSGCWTPTSPMRPCGCTRCWSGTGRRRGSGCRDADCWPAGCGRGQGTAWTER
jgi:hypothetical protein